MKENRIKSERVPIYRDSGFELTDADITRKAFLSESENEHDPGNFIYTRYRNPTVIDAEKEIMEVEGSEWALLTQSGMSAIDTALSIFQSEGDKRPWLFNSEIYGGTESYIDSVLVARRGVSIHRFSPDGMLYDLAGFEDIMKEIRPSLVFFEVLSNPMLIVAPVRKMTDIIHRYGAVAIIDNTFASPFLIKPLEMGADIVVHSATKYLGGHGNITAGVLCGNNNDLMKRAIAYRKLVGHMLSPDDAYRLKTQMQSFALRFSMQCYNAHSIASVLTESELVEKVYYPGLPGHATHTTAKELFRDKAYGAIVTFSFAGADDKEKQIRRDRFIEAVSPFIKLVPTLGDAHTILMPVEPIWGHRYPDPGMIRLSAGFEDTDGLVEKVRSALFQL
jgi:cystathionine beta-lyase/cystathionine gamma-synthase